MKKTFVLLSVLEKRARELKKEKSLKLHQARDEAAKEFGFSNFKHYKNTSNADIKQYKSTLEALFKNIALEDDVAKKMGLAISFIQSHETPFRDLFDILKLFEHSHELGEHPDFEWLDDVHFVCDKLNLMKDEIRSHMFNEFLTGEGENSIHECYPYFTAKELSVSNITYEIKGNTIYADGNYHLTVESDAPDHLKKENPHLRDGKLEGYFGITIDRNKKMTLEHSDISDVTGENMGGPFTEEEVEENYNRFPNERSRLDDMLVLDNPTKMKLSDNSQITSPSQDKHSNLLSTLLTLMETKKISD